MSQEQRKKITLYEIICGETGEKYIGTTEQTVASRMVQHKGAYNFTRSKQIIQRGNYEVKEILSALLCNREKKELESGYIRACLEDGQKVVNNQIPLRTQAEYREVNKEEIRRKRLQAYAENKEKFRQRSRDYYAANAEKVKERTLHHYHNVVKPMKVLMKCI
jgi:hypothetical protein